MLLLLITYDTIGAVNKMSLKYIVTTAYQKQLRRWSGLNTQPLEMMTTYGSVPLPGLPCSPPPHLLHSCRL